MFILESSLSNKNCIERLQTINVTTKDKIHIIERDLSIICLYCLTNASVETDNEFSSPVRHIAKHNVLIIGEAINAQTGKDKKANFAYTPRQTEMGNI